MLVIEDVKVNIKQWHFIVVIVFIISLIYLSFT